MKYSHIAFSLLTILLFGGACTTANKGLITINGQSNNKGDTIILEGYNGNSNIKITEPVLGNKEVSVSFETPLESGLYTVKTPQNNFDFLISDNQPQQFSIVYDSDSVIFNQSDENTAFANFSRYITEQIAIKDVLLEMSADNIAEQKLMLNKFNKQLKQRVDQTKQQFPNSTLALYAELSNQIISETIIWDSINLHNTTLSKLPISESLLFQYYFRTLDPINIELQKTELDLLLKKSKTSTSVYTYFITTLFDLYINSPLPNHNKISEHIAEKYILSSNHKKLFTNEYLHETEGFINYLKANPIGSPAPDIKLKTITGQYESLYNINAKLIVVLFYDPDCATCSETINQLSVVHKQYSNKGLQIFAIYTQNNSYKWKQYVSNNADISSWIHVELGDNESDVFAKYPIAAIPSIFLLNQQKQIIRKDIQASDLSLQIQALLNE